MRVKKPDLGNATQKWVSLLEPSSHSYRAWITASYPARKSSILQQTASGILTRLTDLDLVNFAKEDRIQTQYYLKDITLKDAQGVKRSRKS